MIMNIILLGPCTITTTCGKIYFTFFPQDFRTGGLDIFGRNKVSNLLNQRGPCVAADNAIFSASIVDNTTVCCLLKLQEIDTPDEEIHIQYMIACYRYHSPPNQSHNILSFPVQILL
ncbi:hypothetical protein JTB14_024516 [Gonioctena quinquepunctata]|nr:hypothetical protein JTB14_024516 [Gonioctena quinquepunctata]